MLFNKLIRLGGNIMSIFYIFVKLFFYYCINMLVNLIVVEDIILLVSDVCYSSM